MERMPWVGGSGHATASSLIGDDTAGYLSWGFVRHPVERMVSTLYGRRRNMREPEWLSCADTFDEFVRAVYEPQNRRRMFHTVPMRDYLCDSNGNVVVDFVGRYERISDDWRAIERLVGVPHSKLYALNRSRHRRWEDECKGKVLDMVIELFDDDFKIFGYKV